MSAIRPASIGVSLILTLSLVSALALPSAAADSPVAAGEALLAKLASGDFETLDEVVCAEKAEEVRALFDPASQLGDLPEGMDLEALLSSLEISIEDGAIELVSEEAETATVRLTGTMSMSFFGKSETEALDEELEVVLEDGEWLVCGDLFFGGTGPTEPGGFVSTEGLCATLSIDELNALGPLQYDSNFSVMDSCTYQSSSFEDGFYNLGLSIQAGTLEEWQAWYPDGTDVTVVDTPAWGADSQLFVELPGEEVLNVAPYVDETSQPEGFDALAYATAIAEIVLPRVPDVERFDFGTFDTGPVVEPEPAQEVDLCAALSLDELNALSQSPFDQAESQFGSCSYSSSDFASGFQFVSTSLNPDTTLESFTLFFPDGEELSVAGYPAYYAFEQLFVEVDGHVITVAAFIGDGSGDTGLTNRDQAVQIAETIIPRIPELLAAAGTSVPAETPVPTDLGTISSLCESIDMAAIDALGLEYTDADGTETSCELSTPQYGLRIDVEAADLDAVRSTFPGGQDMEVSGRPAYTDGRTVWVEIGGFGGVLAVDPAFGLAAEAAGIDRVEYATDAAEIVLAGIPGGS